MRVLLVSPSEICYNPRLLKAADYFFSKGAGVIVYNARIGLADDKVYESVKTGRKWKIVENDIDKRTPLSRLRWLYSSLVHKLAVELFKRKIYVGRLVPHVLNKGYVLVPRSLKKEKFDYILIHLVDSLPFAARLKKKTGARLIYDCQEYFKGQYETEGPFKSGWVNYAQDKYVSDVDIVLATTNVMLQRLRQEFSGPGSYFRVRNTPVKKTPQDSPEAGPRLKIIWHGFTIIPKNIRGVHILLEAIANSSAGVELFLQGSITDINRKVLEEMVKKMGIADRVFLREPAHPDEIVQSLAGYDIGAVGELAVQDNQKLTSSNKLFEYINAALAVLVPDLPGLSETVNEYGVGLLYEQGDSKSLAAKIDELHADRLLLQRLKQASAKAAETELFWENDYKNVWATMETLKEKGDR
jgi:glycosyltransferase involved in cell wall biosynthesis